MVGLLSHFYGNFYFHYNMEKNFFSEKLYKMKVAKHTWIPKYMLKYMNLKSSVLFYLQNIHFKKLVNFHVTFCESEILVILILYTTDVYHTFSLTFKLFLKLLHLFFFIFWHTSNSHSGLVTFYRHQFFAYFLCFLYLFYILDSYVLRWLYLLSHEIS